jgi:putative hydroxymethylpyrimidine transport system substrate-binding protein
MALLTAPNLSRLCAAVLGLAAVLTLAGCGEKSEGGSSSAQSLDLTLDFYPNPDHAGIYAGERLGHFDDAGLDLAITTPTDPATPIKQVAAGQTDLAISYAPEVLLAREQGLDVVAVGAIVDEPLTSLIWLAESGIGGVRDLRGRTVATAGIPYQDAYLRSILGRSGVDPGEVDQVDVGLGLLPAILGGRADAILGGFRNIEGVDLAARGRAPVVTPVNELGVPTYDELVLVAQGERLEEDPEPIRLFIAALARGTRAAVANPALATSAVLDANDALDPALTRKETAATLPLLAPAKGEPFGYMDAAEWKEFIAWFRDSGQISSLPAPGEVLTNEYLPGEIPE